MESESPALSGFDDSILPVPPQKEGSQTPFVLSDRDEDDSASSQFTPSAPELSDKPVSASPLDLESKVELNQSQLMLVGPGRAGKTALANVLCGRPYEDTASTLGINETPISISRDSKEKSWNARIEQDDGITYDFIAEAKSCFVNL